jgi:hypothetical protein
MLEANFRNSEKLEIIKSLTFLKKQFDLNDDFKKVKD